MNIRQRIQHRLDHLTKPQGSLGKLEHMVLKLGKIQNTEYPTVQRKRIIVFAGDHGITAQGVSAYPSEVTAQMVLNFVNGGAAISVLSERYDIDLRVVDTGVNFDFPKELKIIHKKIRKGTRDFLEEDAMTQMELEQTITLGKEFAREAKASGVHILGAGEMGIGNTSAASAITSCLLREPLAAVTGSGTGLDSEQLAAKIKTIATALKQREPDPRDGYDILRKVGGYEIAAITGLALGCEEEALPLVADGFIATAGIAIAALINPQVKDIIFPSHNSQEPGHRHLLEYLQLEPFLELDMRLGEGTGAAMAMNILTTAVNLYDDMATFEGANVSQKNL